MNLKNTLLELRKKINIIDKKLLILLSQRRNIAIQIAKNKIINQYPIRDKKREKELLEKLIIFGKKKLLSKNYIQEIFERIIQDSVIIQKKIQKNINIYEYLKTPTFSILGPKGSYSYIAATQYAKKKYENFQIIEHTNFYKIFQAVENKQSNYGIIPIENRSSGFIQEVYDLLYNTNLYIVEELIIPINHCLLVKPSTYIEDIKIVYSHSQPFQQCKNFMEKFPNWKTEYTESTSCAIEKVSRSKKNNTAAIGNENTGIIHGLQSIRKNIANYQNNQTRFIVLTNEKIHTASMKTSKIILMINILKKQYKLSNILLLFKINKISILKIESKKYINKNFIKETCYIEIQKFLKQKTLENILFLLKEKNISIKFIGCYPT
ncbi:chorismate mutase [Buchnera aphidicola]|uniref:chorismate mutase n=1 Tax=Buchnera aphidicola TaxID=9 RepID=UPI00346442A9